MEFTRRIVKYGDSCFISIPKKLFDVMSLNVGDLLKVDFMQKVKLKLITITCPLCFNEFADIENDVYGCPACGNEFIDIESIKNNKYKLNLRPLDGVK